MDSGGMVEVAQFAGWPPAPIELDIPVAKATPPATRLPLKIRKRLTKVKVSGKFPSCAEEIEAKLREAELRRQLFHEQVVIKAKTKPISPSCASQEEDLGQRLQAKLFAAEQKRLSLLAEAQMRLAKLDEQRQAAKSGVEERFENERKELGTRVEFRVQQAEENRIQLLKAYMQRRATLQERKAKSISQRIIRENKYKERVRSAISQKCAAAEMKRMVLLEAEKKRARARVAQARKVAKIVSHQREEERACMKEQLEKRLLKAKRQRTEYLKERGSPRSLTPRSASRMHFNENDSLARQLARCWRQFVGSRKTTVALAQAYEDLGINEKSVTSMPFEQLAAIVESSTTVEIAKHLLDRLESHSLILLSSSSSGIKNSDDLHNSLERENSLPRYPVRIMLFSYMILGHPNYVLNSEGEQEISLKESAVNFVRQFELLIKTVLEVGSVCSPRESSCDATCNLNEEHEEPSEELLSKKTFRSQLSAFDTAWHSYLYQFVVCKLKDPSSLDDLVRTACQLEIPVMQSSKINTCDLTIGSTPTTLVPMGGAVQRRARAQPSISAQACKPASEGQSRSGISHGMRTTRQQVIAIVTLLLSLYIFSLLLGV